jgi:transposase
MHLRFRHYDKVNRKKYHWNLFRTEHQIYKLSDEAKNKTNAQIITNFDIQRFRNLMRFASYCGLVLVFVDIDN